MADPCRHCGRAECPVPASLAKGRPAAFVDLLDCERAKSARLAGELAEANAAVEAMEQRDRWPRCARSLDAPGDVCMVHSPTVAQMTSERDAALARAEAAERVRDGLGEALDRWVRDHRHKPECICVSCAALAAWKARP